MKISLIAALGNNRELGHRGKIPWHIPEELQHFKKTTMGHHLLMGRKTFDSIGRMLPGRKTIVVTRNKHSLHLPSDDCFFVSGLRPGMDLAKSKGEKELFICGGMDIYEQALPLAHYLYLSHIDYAVTADAYFPEFKDEEWKLVTQEIHPIENDLQAVAWRFELLERRKKPILV